MGPGRGSRGGRLGLQLQQLGLQSGRYILLSLFFYNRCLPGEGGSMRLGMAPGGKPIKQFTLTAYIRVLTDNDCNRDAKVVKRLFCNFAGLQGMCRLIKKRKLLTYC